MFKITPNPPVTDPASPYESPDSKKFHEAAERALDHYLGPPTAEIMAAPYKPNALYMAKQSAGEPPQPKGAFTRPFPLPLPRNLDGKLKEHANNDPLREH